MSLANSIIYAYKTDFNDVKEILLSKINTIDYDDTKAICRYFRQHVKYQKMRRYTTYSYENMINDINNIYELFIDKWEYSAQTYLYDKKYIKSNIILKYLQKNATEETLLRTIHAYLSKTNIIWKKPKLNTGHARTVFKIIPPKFRIVDFFEKLVNINRNYFCAISPKFKDYDILCTNLLKKRIDIFEIIPPKYITNEMLRLYINLTTKPICISNYISKLDADIIIHLFNTNRLLYHNWFNVNKNLYSKLFDIDYIKSFSLYMPSIHGVDFIPLFLEKGFYDVLKHSKDVTFDMVKSLPDLYKLMGKYKLYNLLYENYLEFIKIDKNYIDMFMIHNLDDAIYQNNRELIMLTLEYNSIYFNRLSKYIDYDTIIFMIANGLYKYNYTECLNSTIKNEVCNYLLNRDISCYRQIWYSCNSIMTPGLVDKILDYDIDLYRYIPDKFKNVENTKLYLDMSKYSNISRVPISILEIMGKNK
jgi:hypothetical protein